MLGLLKKWWRPKQPVPILKPVKVLTPMEEIELVRDRLKGLGWKILEIPIRGGAKGYRVVASKGQRSFSLDGPSLHQALQQLGKTLGVR